MGNAFETFIKRQTAIVLLIVIAVCMSGYIIFMPEVFDASIKEMRKKAEKLNESFLFKDSFIVLHGGFSRVLGKKMIIDVSRYNDVYKLNNGHLTIVRPEPGENVDGNARALAEFYEYARQNDIEFLFILAPHKVDNHDDGLPRGVVDYTNKNADRFMESIIKSGVPYVDLRETIHEQGLDWYDGFFKTDHHWTAEMGLWAAKYVMNEYLREYLPGDMSLYDADNYDVSVYRDVFLGSWGRRTGRLYAGVDDISVITPKFDTNLRVEIPSANYLMSGSFADTLIDYSYLEGNAEDTGAYDDIFMVRDKGAHIINDNGNGKTCLILADSFGRVFIPFISLSFSETYAGMFAGNMTDYIAKTQPDVILFLINAYNVDPFEAYFDFGLR
ncbi:MAG: DHHW family protein [Oscillospiraceae bacterium]|nr:DHHW family protein [Oscillospiraceae bacterium]